MNVTLKLENSHANGQKMKKLNKQKNIKPLLEIKGLLV
jgi:hypothetical protein